MKKFNSRVELLKMIHRYVDGLATEEEKSFLETYYDYAGRGEDGMNSLSAEQTAKFETRLRQVLMEDAPSYNPVRPVWNVVRGISAAAAILLIIATGLYFYKDAAKNTIVQLPKPAAPNNDISPGGNIALLTLADGTKINLDDAGTGTVVEQSGISIRKSADGKLVYTVAATAAKRRVSLANSYNTIETPRGGEYQIDLPDGTRVWLNAGSSLRYPISFDGKERRVKLEGEAYFEVAYKKAKPFLVESNGQTVEVLGTHFNVNSYHDEATVKTTLLEGSVRVNIPGQPISQFLKPGQQSLVGKTGSSITVKNIDVEQAVAWKNGYFIFSNEDIQSIMRQLSRWYNVEVEYKGKIPAESFGGNVSKTKNISEILRILELTKAVRFEIKGRRVIVMK